MEPVRNVGPRTGATYDVLKASRGESPWGYRSGPSLGQVREPLDHCETCGVSLTETCRQCWECMDRERREKTRDAGPAEEQ